MVHMPSHIYLRLGDYERSAECNRRAIRADDAYRARANPQGFYLMYVAHNHQFLMASCWMMGRREEALREARATLDVVPVDMLRQMPGFDLVLGYPAWTHLRFGRWDEVLAEPPPPPDFAYAAGAWRAARGLALLALGRPDEAAAERDSLLEIRKIVPAGTVEGLNDAHVLLDIANGMLSGAIAAKRGQVDEGVKLMAAAAAAEDGLRYNEPRDWYVPVRHLLGSVLLAADRPAEAQKVYETDLDRNPENAWALAGLVRSLRAQGQAKPAAAAEARVARAAKSADVRITASWM
jgi:tetratricopeptide (TPR) repeat protein